MPQQTDTFLVQQLNEGNKSAFEEVYKAYYPRLVAFAEGYLFDLEKSKGLVQKFFIYLWLNATDIQIQSSLKSYLFTSVKNRCLNHIRSLKISDRNKLQYIEAMLRSEEAMPIDQPSDDLGNELLNELNKLPDQIKKILVFKYFDGKKQSEIAEILGISENTVKTQIKRGKEKLRSRLNKNLLVLFPFF